MHPARKVATGELLHHLLDVLYGSDDETARPVEEEDDKPGGYGDHGYHDKEHAPRLGVGKVCYAVVQNRCGLYDGRGMDACYGAHLLVKIVFYLNDIEDLGLSCLPELLYGGDIGKHLAGTWSLEPKCLGTKLKAHQRILELAYRLLDGPLELGLLLVVKGREVTLRKVAELYGPCALEPRKVDAPSIRRVPELLKGLYYLVELGYHDGHLGIKCAEPPRKAAAIVHGLVKGCLHDPPLLLYTLELGEKGRVFNGLQVFCPVPEAREDGLEVLFLGLEYRLERLVVGKDVTCKHVTYLHHPLSEAP